MTRWSLPTDSEDTRLSLAAASEQLLPVERSLSELWPSTGVRAVARRGRSSAFGLRATGPDWGLNRSGPRSARRPDVLEVLVYTAQDVRKKDDGVGNDAGISPCGTL